MTDPTPETARLTADVVLFGERDGAPRVLLIKRGWPPFEGCRALPGGHVDQGEETDVAARRELLEETGIDLGDTPLDYSDAYAAPDRDPRGRYVTFAYAAYMDGPPEPTAGDDAAEAQWWPVDEVLADGSRLAFDHRRIIADAAELAP